MRTFMVFCEDGENGPALRAAHLQEHLAYVETIMERIRVAGPLREDESEEVSASCLIYSAESLDEARALFEADPYFRAGIYASVRWFRMTPAAGEWVGGRNW